MKSAFFILLRYALSKLKWDFNIKKRIRNNSTKLKSFKNIHRGKRCFIVATGPSLTLDDVNKLRNEITFGVNGIINVLDFTDWRPTYFCVTDAKVYDKIKCKINRLKDIRTVFFHDIIHYPYENGAKIAVMIRMQLWHNTKLQKKYPNIFPYTWFSDDITKCVFDGRTVVYSVLQIAAYMGFKEIYLLGTDCNYRGMRSHAKIAENDFTSTQATAEDIIAGDTTIECYKVAEKYSKTHNFHIFNATRGGALEVFDRVDIDTILNSTVGTP